MRIKQGKAINMGYNSKELQMSCCKCHRMYKNSSLYYNLDGYVGEQYCKGCLNDVFAPSKDFMVLGEFSLTKKYIEDIMKGKNNVKNK